MKNYTKSISKERIFAWFVFLLFIRFIFDRLQAGYSIITGRSSIDYGTFDISDWLINYEGGFVRRGILGQILWECEQFHLYDVRIAISIICFITSLAILLLLFRIFKEEGWSMLIIPTGFVLGFTIFGLGGRRDLLSLLLTYLIFYLYKSAITHTGKKRIWWSLFYFISILQILIHEASFFYTFPLLILFLFQKNRNSKWTLSRNCKMCLLQFMPIIIIMGIVCIFKGDKKTAEIIWNSWNNIFAYFPYQGDTTSIGAGIEALSWETQETFFNHLKAGYIGVNSPSYLRIPIVIFNLLAAYLLVSRINTIDMGIYRKKQMDNVLMSNVLSIQFVAMTPMFTVLSCDWGRTIPYWLLTSLFFYHLFKNERIEVGEYLTKVSRDIQNYISSSSILRNKFTYILLVLLSPIPGACAPFDSANTFQQGIIATCQSTINNLITFMQ